MSARSSKVVASLSLLVASCGYGPVHGHDAHDAHDAQGRGAREHLHVVLAESKVPDASASDEVVAGVREALARGGRLAPGDGFPRCEVEVLRADEASEGIAASPAQGGGFTPQSRATRVGIVARAWILRTPNGERERDTGDVRVFETVSIAVDSRAATFRHSDALRAAGRRLGSRLAARIMGLPASSDE